MVKCKVVEEQGRVTGPWERKVVGWNSTGQAVEEVQHWGSAIVIKAGDVRVRTYRALNLKSQLNISNSFLLSCSPGTSWPWQWAIRSSSSIIWKYILHSYIVHCFIERRGEGNVFCCCL